MYRYIYRGAPFFECFYSAKYPLSVRNTDQGSDHPTYSGLDQYFPVDIIKLNNNECSIDGGAYNGDTISQLKHLLRKAKLKMGTIVAFEPDNDNFEKLQKNYPSIVCHKVGLWNSNTVLNF